MDRRQFLKGITIPLLSTGCASVAWAPATPSPHSIRVRRGDPAWPTDALWNELRAAVGGRLIAPGSPFAACQSAATADACADTLRALNNPYYLGDDPALTQTSGWLDAWTSAPSVYAVAAETAADVAAAVNFARTHRLRLVVKGGGHSYQGTSCAADSLLIWTRAMKRITLHDGFVPRGCDRQTVPQPAVTVGAGAVWMPVYGAVSAQGGRYVQGGGCATVGVAGLIQSGGFGSFSKKFGLAAASLLEADIVTADGVLRRVNACSEPDLFWALKGGGGGSFGVVTQVTLRTHDLPEYFGAAFGTIRARSDEAFRRLTAFLIGCYRNRLFNPHWGEQLRFESGNTVDIRMVFQGRTRQEAEADWLPFREWVEKSAADFEWRSPLAIAAIPARRFWDPSFLRQNLSQLIVVDDRPGAPEGNVLWAGDREQAGQFLHGYRSAWLSASLLEPEHQGALVDAIVAASHHWSVSLHFNKGLAGSPAGALAAARDTATNPAMLDAFALAIIAGAGPVAFPGLPDHAPNVDRARDAQAIDRAMDALSVVMPEPASYVSESNFFEPAWQQAFWGANYPRLAAVKRRYDPDGLFFVHHGAGSEGWSHDGFERLKA
jgi:FAD/FMN-containing dehydrogenase